MNKMSIDLKVGETLTIGGATVRLVKKSGQLARLEVSADPSIQIDKPRRFSSMAPWYLQARRHTTST